MSIALVQQKSASADAISGATLVTTLDAPSASGSVLVLCTGVGSGAADITVVTDSQSGTWTELTDERQDACAQVFVRTAGAAGVTTVTVTNPTGSQRAIGTFVSEWSGLTTTATAAEDTIYNIIGTSGTVIQSAGIVPLLVDALIICSVIARTTAVSDIDLQGYTELTAPADAGDSTFAAGYVIDSAGARRAVRAVANASVGNNRFIAVQRALVATGAVAPTFESVLPERLARPTPLRTLYVHQLIGDDTRSVTLAQDPATPWATVQKALDNAQAGDLIYVKHGVYEPAAGWGSFRWAPDISRKATALNPVWMKNYPGHFPVLRGGVDEHNGNNAMLFRSNASIFPEYFGLEGFICEVNPALAEEDPTDYTKLIEFWADERECSFIELSKLEVRGATSQGLYVDGDFGSQGNQIWDCHFHDNGTNTVRDSRAGFQHGIYAAGDGLVIANCLSHDHARGYGIQLYVSAGPLTSCFVVNNTSVENYSGGIVIGGEDGSTVTDNVFANNVVANNGTSGIQVYDDPEGEVSGNLGFNNLGYNNPDGNFDSDSGTMVYYGSIDEEDPEFIEPDAKNFRIGPTSPAIDEGAIGYTPANDKDGSARSTVDLGAYADEADAPPASIQLLAADDADSQTLAAATADTQTVAGASGGTQTLTPISPDTQTLTIA